MAKKEEVIREVKLTDSTKLVISSFINDDGEKHMNLRKFYKKKSAEAWLPARQGMTLPQEKCKKSIKMMIECYQNMDDEAVKLAPRKDKKGGDDE
jgi:hypothetical protein